MEKVTPKILQKPCWNCWCCLPTNLLNFTGYESLYFDNQTTYSYTVEKGVDNYPVPLVIKPNTLKEGATYKFRLGASHKDGDGSGEVEVTVNAAPQNCQPAVCVINLIIIVIIVLGDKLLTLKPSGDLILHKNN